MDLDALLAEADAVFEAEEPTTVDVLIGDKDQQIRLWPLDGPAWRDLIAQHPPRQLSTYDHNAGYNVDAVVLAYPRIALVTESGVDNMVDRDEKGAERSRWPDVHKRLAPNSLKELALTVWGMHDLVPRQRLDEAKKASSSRRRKLTLPASSE